MSQTQPGEITTTDNQRLWDIRFLRDARTRAAWSKDPSTKAGAVLTRGKLPISQGFNGFAHGVKDTTERLNNRQVKYQLVIHAEVNAILHTNGPLDGTTMYVTHPPCAACASVIAQKRVSRAVWIRPSAEFMQRWSDSVALSMEVLSEAGVSVVEYSLDEVDDPNVV